MKSAGAKGEKYVYKYVKYYRNAEGAPRNKAKAIGKFDPESGKMYPNNNYYDIYQLDPSLLDISFWDYGYSYLVLKVCRDIGLLDCLAQVFGRRTIDVVIIAAYIIREGTAMNGIDDWQLRNYFPGVNHLLTSKTTSKIFASLTNRQRNEFFKYWVKVALGSGSICYDVTSISSYSQEMPMIKRVKMILGGGFWSKKCLTNLQEFCDAFTIGMPLYLKDSEKIIAAYGADIEKYKNELSCYHHIYCIPVNTEIYGVPGRVLIYYDSYNHLNQCIEMSNNMTG